MILYDPERVLNETLVTGKRLRLISKKIKELNAQMAYMDASVVESGLERERAAYTREAAKALVGRLAAAPLLDMVQSADSKIVLEARYIMGLKWEEVADITHYSLVHAHRLAREGMRELKEAGKRGVIRN